MYDINYMYYVEWYINMIIECNKFLNLESFVCQNE